MRASRWKTSNVWCLRTGSEFFRRAVSVETCCRWLFRLPHLEPVSPQQGSRPQVSAKRRIAVLSPFVDKRHGTERCVAEQVERLADRCEIHLYSERVEDTDLSKIVWHRIPALPGPHAVKYVWWFAANHLWRWWDRRLHGLVPDLVYSPGINCVDADVISVHIVFAEFYRRVKKELSLRRNPMVTWPQLIHRRLYYRLIQALERRIYTREDLPLAV